MAFKLVTGPYVVWQDVRIQRLDEDGTPRTARVRLKFKILDDDEVQRALPAGEMGDPSSERALDFLASVTLDWDGVVDEQGQSVAYDEALYRRLLKYPFFSAPVVRAYFAAREGRREKN